jgi:hypothetical protein
MADPEALAVLLKKDLLRWSSWRSEHPGRVDLRTADLSGLVGASGIDLSNVDLSRAHLNGASLLGTSFTDSLLVNASLGQARLGRSIFQRADLSGANLTETDLSRANLQHANLSRAKLIGTTFRGGNLRGTNFAGAELLNTVFAEVDLSQAIGLDECKHHAPSTIGADTIFASRGNIPRGFLRSAGVPGVLIEQMKALVGAMAPIQFYSCFISYSTKDQDFADRLYTDLLGRSVNCFLATEDLRIGDPFRQCIDEAIHLRDKLLLILSEHSVQSAWVQDEVEAALERELKEDRLVLFPIRIDDAVMDTQQAWAASIRRKRHIGDFRRWQEHGYYMKGLERLLGDLKAEGEQDGK